MKTIGKFLAALFLSIGLMFTIQEAPPAAAVQAEGQELFYGTTVSWGKGAQAGITVVGVGVEALKQQTNSAAGQARHIALGAARRNLLKTVLGLQIDESTVLEPLLDFSGVADKLSSVLRDAKIVEEGRRADKSYYVKLSVPLYGPESIAAAVLPALREQTKAMAWPEVTGAAELSAAKQKQLREGGYTGLVIDASDLGLQEALAPQILDTAGRVLYSVNYLDLSEASSKGLTGYSDSIKTAVATGRAGARPLVLKALAVDHLGKGPVVNAVVTEKDGNRMLLANEQAKFLDKCAVVFVK